MQRAVGATHATCIAVMMVTKLELCIMVLWERWRGCRRQRGIVLQGSSRRALPPSPLPRWREQAASSHVTAAGLPHSRGGRGGRGRCPAAVSSRLPRLRMRAAPAMMLLLAVMVLLM